jgi:hypothetical protein
VSAQPAVTSGITSLPAVCWVLVEPGRRVEAEGPHYDGQAAALAVATAEARYGDQPRVPMALDRPCWQAIAVCGETYAGDGEFSCVHFPDEATARDILPADDWTTGPGGALSCGRPSCSPCGELRSIEVPAPPVEVAGQLPLFMAEATPDSGGQGQTAFDRRDVGVSACLI